jgi:hypothetical protein
LVNTLFWKILVTRVNRKMSRIEYGGDGRAGFGTALPSASSPKIRAREQDKHLFIQKDFAARGNPNRRDRIVSRGETSSGGAAARESNGGRTTMRGETQGGSRTTVRARSGGDRVAVHGRGHTAVGVRSAASDDAVIIIKRKKARRYVYSEPSTTIVKKRRYTRYHEPSSAVIVKKRRAGVAVDSGVSTRTSVRSRTSTAVSGYSTKRTGTTVRERPSGQGNAGASSTEGRAPSGARSGGANTGRSAPSGGANQAPTGQQ